MTRKSIVLALALIMTTFTLSKTAFATGACPGTWTITGYTTTANTCGYLGQQYYQGHRDDYYQWPPSGGGSVSYFNPIFGYRNCIHDAMVYELTDGTYIDTNSDPWIDYSFARSATFYVNDETGVKSFIDAQRVLNCERSHPSPVTIKFTPGFDFKFTTAEDGVDFDLTSSGTKERFGWTNPVDQQAFLIRGPVVTNGSQLFGNLSPQAPALTADERENGFRALRLNDANNDGVINASDAVFTDLFLWFDDNHDGISQPEEVVSLGSKVASISLDYQKIGKKDPAGNLLSFKAEVTLNNGSKRFAVDYFPTQIVLVNTKIVKR